MPSRAALVEAALTLAARRADDVVIEHALELAEAVDELQAHQSLLMALNSDPIGLGQPHLRALAVVRAGALRSAIGLVVAILSPPGKDRINLGQIFALLEDQVVADRLTAPNPKRRNLPERPKLDEARVRHAQLIKSEGYARVRDLRNSIAHLLREAITDDRVPTVVEYLGHLLACRRDRRVRDRTPSGHWIGATP